MSRRSRKRGLATIADARVAPRALHEASRVDRAYPRADELLAVDGGAWRAQLAGLLRGVLRPAAMASAVGLAGCGGTPPATDNTTSTTTVQTTTTTTTATTTPDTQNVQTVLPVTDIPCAGAPPPMQPGAMAQDEAPAPAPPPSPPGHVHHPRTAALP